MQRRDWNYVTKYQRSSIILVRNADMGLELRNKTLFLLFMQKRDLNYEIKHQHFGNGMQKRNWNYVIRMQSRNLKPTPVIPYSFFMCPVYINMESQAKTERLKVLFGCECSQVLTRVFRDLGHEDFFM